MRILICDDDKIVLEQLRTLVSDYFREHGGQQPDIVCYGSSEALLRGEARADIAFLDVEMPGINGIQLGAILKERNPHIKIFIVTSYPDYLDEAMRFQVFRYLSKPIDKDRLFRNLKDAVYQHSKVPAPFLRLCSLEYLPSGFYTGSMGVDPEKQKEPEIREQTLPDLRLKFVFKKIVPFLNSPIQIGQIKKGAANMRYQILWILFQTFSSGKCIYGSRKVRVNI